MNCGNSFLENIAPEIRVVTDFIHDHPELGYHEFEAAAHLKAFLKKHGFVIEENAGGVETAFKARFRTADAVDSTPHFAVMGEYDALKGLGHGCGHNLISGAALATVLAAKDEIEKQGIPADLCFVGTPAEESLGGKVRMIEGHAFDEFDCAIIAHPFDRTTPDFGCLSVARALITFHGRASHAAFAPEQGLNALDAMVDFYNDVRNWKKGIDSRERVHGIITKGGDAPNIVPELTEAFFYVRAPNESMVSVLKQKMESSAKLGAEANHCKGEVNWISAYKGMIFNAPLNRAFAEFWKSAYGEILPVTDGTEGRGSTDTGDVSYLMPAAHFYFGITEGRSVALHTEAFKKEAGTTPAFEAAMKTGNVMSKIVLRYYTDSVFRREVGTAYAQAEK